MRVSKRNVSIWNLAAPKIGVSNRDAGIDETRTPYDGKIVQPHRQSLHNTEMFAERVKRLKLASFSPLSIARVKTRQLVILAGDRRSHTAIHAAAHQDHSFVGCGFHDQELEF